MKKIGIGYENYKEFIDQNLYYVDKTLLVRDILEKGGKVTQLTRPRRFGKTLGLSMLTGMTDYTARSNREAGDGRPAITLYPENPPDPAYIFECKVRKKFNQMQGGLVEAFAQIRTRRYEEGILDEGYAGAVSFGICFCKKSCIVGLYRDNVS